MGTTVEGTFQLTAPTYPKGILLGDITEPTQSIVEESSTQHYHLNTSLVYSDGRKFRYSKNGGTALSKALMTTSEALYGYVLEETQSTYGTSAEIGDHEIDIDVTTGGSYTENEFADGWLIVGTGTGIGDIYKILANKINGSDDTLMRVLLERPIRTAWAANTVITLVKNPRRDVDVMPTTAEGTPAGIPLIDVTIDYYCWLQTGGYAPCLVDTDDTLIKGQPAGYPTSPAVPGACGVPAATDAVWGIAVYIAAAGKAAILDLKLDS